MWLLVVASCQPLQVTQLTLLMPIVTIVVEATIPDEDPINNPQGSINLIRLGLNFDLARTNSVMTCVLVLSARVRRMSSYGMLQTLIICLGQLLPSKNHNNFNICNGITEKIAILLSSIFLHRKKYALPYTSSDLAQNLSCDRL